MNYTKGEWTIWKTHNAGNVIITPEKQIATVITGFEWDELGKQECEANARLIAAAPELYEALKNLVDYYDNWQKVHYQYLSEAHDILEKLDGFKI